MAANLLGVDFEMVVNELSLVPIAQGVEAAKQRMRVFVQTIVSGVRMGMKTVRVADVLDTWVLAPHYPFARWRNDRSVDIEARRFLKSVVTRSPLLQGLDCVRDMLGGCEFRRGDAVSHGLGVAFLTRGLAISLQSSAFWQAPMVELDLIKLCDDGRLETEEVSVEHASSSEHVKGHEQWVRHRLGEVEDAAFRAIATGAQLWSQRNLLFPWLEFCDRVEAQLAGLREGHEILPHVVDRLRRLDRAATAWGDGPFDPGALRIAASPQSEATLQRYRLEHTFRCPDGCERLFSWHTRLPQGWRIHFTAESPSTKMIVGHVGEHLPTVRFH